MRGLKEFSRFTGFVDKNGNEIYEGDNVNYLGDLTTVECGEDGCYLLTDLGGICLSEGEESLYEII